MEVDVSYQRGTPVGSKLTLQRSWVPTYALQGYFAHEKLLPPRTLHVFSEMKSTDDAVKGYLAHKKTHTP